MLSLAICTFDFTFILRFTIDRSVMVPASSASGRFLAFGLEMVESLVVVASGCLMNVAAVTVGSLASMLLARLFSSTCKTGAGSA